MFVNQLITDDGNLHHCDSIIQLQMTRISTAVNGLMQHD